MPSPSKSELRESLLNAETCACLALAGGSADSPLRVRVALEALQGAVKAVENARFIFFDISPEEEEELRVLVRRIQSVFIQLLARVDQWLLAQRKLQARVMN